MRIYNRDKVFNYAKKWAYYRNPKYYNFDSIGGDCTNFASQCIYAGFGEMNYSKNNGWYYINGNERSPSWTGVEFLFNFLTKNNGLGPIGNKTTIDNLEVGDLVQLSFKQNIYSHSLIVIEKGNSISNTFVAAHTFDTFGKRVSQYKVENYRCVHIN